MSMRYFCKAVCIFALSAVLCCCEENTPEEVTAVTSETTSATTENKYLLVRGFTADELMKSIYFCGGYHPLPIVPEENEGFVVSDGYMYLPDGSQAEVITDENGRVTRIAFERSSAPQDLSVLGIDLTSVPDDIPDKIGIAEFVYGDGNSGITYSFYGGGVGELTFMYTENRLEKVCIAVESK